MVWDAEILVFFSQINGNSGVAFRCVGQVRKLAAGGGHSAVLTDAFSLKELCEFQLADSVNLSNASKIQDVAFRMGSEALARLCERLR